MPKYQEIANILRTRIKNKTYPPDSLLPNQTDLVEEFGVSRMTVKKAIGILAMEGLVYSQRGAGTKILNHPFLKKDTTALTVYEGLSTEMGKAGRKLVSQVIDFQVEFPDQTIQEKLMLTEEQPIYSIVRLRILEDQPFYFRIYLYARPFSAQFNSWPFRKFYLPLCQRGTRGPVCWRLPHHRR